MACPPCPSSRYKRPSPLHDRVPQLALAVGQLVEGALEDLLLGGAVAASGADALDRLHRLGLHRVEAEHLVVGDHRAFEIAHLLFEQAPAR